MLITDSYCYTREHGPVPGTPAAETGDISLPWWNINPWVKNVKFKQLHRAVPKDMPIVNLQQGMFNTSEGHCLPNIGEEHRLYKEEFGLSDTFAVYPHGQGQAMNAVTVMRDERPQAYSLKNQCRELMARLT